MPQDFLDSLPTFLRGIPQEFTYALLDPKYFWPLLLIAVMCGQMYFVNKSRRAILALARKIRQEHSLIPSQEVSGESSALMGYSNELERIQRKLDDMQCRLPLVITEQLLKKLQCSTFAILDKQGHPVACGFFVTPCGVALTAARNAVFLRPPLKRGGKKVFTASTCAMHEFHLEVVVSKVGALDIAVLRVIPSATLPPRDHLSLPAERLEAYKLFGAYCTMIHCCVTWSDNEKAALVAHETGYIVTSSENMLLYRVTSYERHSGAAIMFSSGQLIGLHSQPVNDGECDPSGLSYNTSGEAVRLDVPAIKEAVEGAKIGGEVLDKSGETLWKTVWSYLFLLPQKCD